KTAKHRTIVSVSIANMRTRPSTTAAVITTLSRDTEVVPIERRGSWVFIRIGDGARKQEGWVFGSNLLDMTGP
ncbi:MAG TPA: SH3 domain-containing protein, partial [Stellaceae bacterium]|nr:SH3 domain-containing protein [Stellaceae bacterium]